MRRGVLIVLAVIAFLILAALAVSELGRPAVYWARMDCIEINTHYNALVCLPPLIEMPTGLYEMGLRSDGVVVWRLVCELEDCLEGMEP